LPIRLDIADFSVCSERAFRRDAAPLFDEAFFVRYLRSTGRARVMNLETPVVETPVLEDIDPSEEDEVNDFMSIFKRFILCLLTDD
jgi:hypothetical protein